MKVNGSIESDLQYQALDYKENYIPYIKRHVVYNVLQYDSYGVEMARQYAYSQKDFRPMTFEQGYFELFTGAVTMDAFQPVAGRHNKLK